MSASGHAARSAQCRRRIGHLRYNVVGVRAIEYSVTGDPEVLTLVDRPVPDPGPGEVRVRIHRSGVNPTDWKSRRGSEAGAAVDPPQVPNQDGSGVVDAVGQGVEAALLGLRVWIWEAAHLRPAGGTAQEYAVVPARHVVLLPDVASFSLGASLGVPFLTAHRCLTVTEDGPARLGPGTMDGRTVLVAGGAGAVGNAAIQLARWSDATVITTVSSPQKGHLAAHAGADHIIDYRQQDVVAEVHAIEPDGVNTIVEVSPALNAAIDVQVLARHGSVAVYANNGGSAMELPIRPSMVPNVRWQFVLVYDAPQEWRARALEDVTAAVLDGAVRVGDEAGLPLHHYTLEQAAEAHAAVEKGAVGKVLIDVRPE
jgi:NADPH2:quinone reductase